MVLYLDSVSFFAPYEAKNDTQEIEHTAQAEVLCMFFFSLQGEKEHT
jgi:hypothetical protein